MSSDDRPIILLLSRLVLALVSVWSLSAVSLIAVNANELDRQNVQRAATTLAAEQGRASPVVEVPQKARELFKTLQERDGTPLPGYVGGKAFHNRERRLPKGRYREYDVNPKQRGRPRDSERIVIEQRTQKAYYTPDHYRTFVPLN